MRGAGGRSLCPLADSAVASEQEAWTAVVVPGGATCMHHLGKRLARGDDHGAALSIRVPPHLTKAQTI